MCSISDVCELLDIKPHVLRYWEHEISLLSPKKNLAGRRFYSGRDVQILLRVKHLLYDEKYTLRGANEKIWREIRTAKPDILSQISALRGMLIDAVRQIRRGMRKIMDKDALIELFSAEGQEQLFDGWAHRDEDYRHRLLSDLRGLDMDLLASMQNALGKKTDSPAHFEPAAYTALTDPVLSEDVAKLGQQMIKTGKAAFLTVAGGQGSRLGFEGPKGMYPISPIRKVSLFQIFAEKVRAANKKYGVVLRWYIMTSPKNHERSIDFFKEHSYFGLEFDQVIFFPQGELPSLDDRGKLLIAPDGGLLKNPDGHGGLVAALMKHNLFEDMKSRGIEELFYFQVDNPLVTVPDAMFLGVHRSLGSSVSTKVLKKSSPEEKLGSIGMVDGKKCIIEYSDLDADSMHAVDDTGQLLYSHGSIAIHIFNVDFMSKKELVLPYHIARKKVNTLMYKSGKAEILEKEGLKLEKFIFDLIPLADQAIFFEVVREEEFAPLKNKAGADSVQTCLSGQVEKAARLLESCGVAVQRDENDCPSHKIEISPLFALDLESLRKRLADQTIKINADKLFV